MRARRPAAGRTRRPDRTQDMFYGSREAETRVVARLMRKAKGIISHPKKAHEMSTFPDAKVKLLID